MMKYSFLSKIKFLCTKSTKFNFTTSFSNLSRLVIYSTHSNSKKDLFYSSKFNYCINSNGNSLKKESDKYSSSTSSSSKDGNEKTGKFNNKNNTTESNAANASNEYAIQILSKNIICMKK